MVEPEDSSIICRRLQTSGHGGSGIGCVAHDTNAQEEIDRDLEIPVIVEESNKELVITPMTVQLVSSCRRYGDSDGQCGQSGAGGCRHQSDRLEWSNSKLSGIH